MLERNIEYPVQPTVVYDAGILIYYRVLLHYQPANNAQGRRRKRQMLISWAESRKQQPGGFQNWTHQAAVWVVDLLTAPVMPGSVSLAF
jgi:hypothetical protein